MRPLRFLLLLGLFIVLPIILTCVSLFSGRRSSTDSIGINQHARTNRFRALFSFTTPSSLFPPSVIISLTDDNSTSFLARPAFFGPSLPTKGLSAQLWVGKGFGEESISEEQMRFSGFELGCSDVPGWNDDHKNRPENGAVDSASKSEIRPKSKVVKRDDNHSEPSDGSALENDGTDDHLHHPLPDSNPASPEKPGEPASVNNQDKSKPPTHADIESLQESADIAGKIVMLSRGGCGFLEKVKWAQRRGGVGVIVGDNEPGGQLIGMWAKGDTTNVTIPAIFTSYFSAHLLSTLVPSEDKNEVDIGDKLRQIKDGKSEKDPKSREGYSDRTILGPKKKASQQSKAVDSPELRSDKGWIQSILSAVGLGREVDVHGKDSRRPPGSGNIDWVLQNEWDEDRPIFTSTETQILKAMKTGTTSNSAANAQTTAIEKLENDDFIIGVQDWRDTELIAPKATSTQPSNKRKGRIESATSQLPTSTSSSNPTATALKGGSITPGSGEYDHDKGSLGTGNSGKKSLVSSKHSHTEHHQSLGAKIACLFRWRHHDELVHILPHGHPSDHDFSIKKGATNEEDGRKEPEHKGLWVTLTPANPSTSPFFDTLLVLVVSPLVTLSFVYALLLLRSRIRRRRWRAPKSIVERLPVRTYHTMSSTSSTTSSSLTSPQPSTTTSPELRPTSHNRVRPRSQTTTGVISSTEKSANKSSPKRKRYAGRQVECVVCLEEYVDGESQVMSLPCGHEFHVDCITPWLVTRRRTCPICKGDVVRSLARSNGGVSSASPDARDSDEQTSDDIQDRAAMTENPDGTAAIPIPVTEDLMDNDIERGSDVETPLLGSTPRPQQSRWRGMLHGSLNRLSGDTVWRSGESSVSDRNR